MPYFEYEWWLEDINKANKEQEKRNEEQQKQYENMQSAYNPKNMMASMQNSFRAPTIEMPKINMPKF